MLGGHRATPAPALVVLRAQLDATWPDRKRASDGIMGDSAHQGRKSDHNQGNAIDVTAGNGNSLDVGALWEAFRRQMSVTPTGRISYLIFSRRIASPIDRWAWRPYTGPNPHLTHGHLSIKDGQRAETRPWKLR